MAFVATTQTLRGVSRHSVGPFKFEYVDWSAATGDTTGTITASNLSTVYFCILTGLTQTAQPTYSGAVATLAFADPLATVKGKAILIGE